MTPMRRPGAPIRPERWWVVALACVSACTVADGNLGRLRAHPDAGAACALNNPVVSVGGAPTCPGRLAASLLSNALCVCGDAQVATTLVTRGFDSRRGPYASMGPNQGGASVAVNGTYVQRLAGDVDVGGSFSVAGTADMRFTGALTVRGDFWSAGNVSVTGGTGVSRNASLAGTFTGKGPLGVAGTLAHGGAVSAIPLYAGADRPGPVTVPAACPCGPSDLLDIGAIVGAARTDNDNQALQIRSDQLAALDGSAVTMTLPCGRVYLTAIAGHGDVTVHVNGMTALFVDGSIALAGNLLFDIVPGAELDVFVRDDAAVVLGTLTLAKQEHPSAGRIWIGGSHPIGPLPSPWVGMLYAPHASVSAIVGLTVYGAIFAGSFSGDLTSTFIYDRAVLNAAANCAAPQPAAGACRQCGSCSGGDACVGGVCSACSTDADCCSLSICANGSCAPLMESTSGPP
ncbi:MAG TPA: hypothetical protein VHM31_13075 [Polyangia bacterium]|nr:hypothetical protein [Polyangia bacterium]